MSRRASASLLAFTRRLTTHPRAAASSPARGQPAPICRAHVAPR
jgi:hypothetical protein